MEQELYLTFIKVGEGVWGLYLAFIRVGEGVWVEEGGWNRNST